MNEVEMYIDNLSDKQKLIAYEIHFLMLSYPNITAKIRYRIPFYFRKSWITYINPLKNGNLEFCFLRANELSNESGILDFKKRKQVAGIEISSVDQVGSEAMILTIEEALVLDQNVKYSVKKK